MSSGALRLAHALDDPQIDQLVDLYRGLWWASDRRRDDVVRMLAGCLPFALIDDHAAGGAAIAAFARVVTDGVYKALIFDIVVAPAHRSTGLGTQLIDTLLAHPSVAQVAHVELYCLPELVPFYQRWGFRHELGELTFMRRA